MRWVLFSGWLKVGLNLLVFCVWDDLDWEKIGGGGGVIDEIGIWGWLEWEGEEGSWEDCWLNWEVKCGFWWGLWFWLYCLYWGLWYMGDFVCWNWVVL